MKYLNILMAFIYIVLGVVLLVQPGQILSIPAKYKIPLGITLTLYGLFRAYTVYQKNRHDSKEDNNA
jgi:hypothetical protein